MEEEKTLNWYVFIYQFQ